MNKEVGIKRGGGENEGFKERKIEAGRMKVQLG
jgi:hypothetical protein